MGSAPFFMSDLNEAGGFLASLNVFRYNACKTLYVRGGVIGVCLRDHRAAERWEVDHFQRS